MRSPFQSHLIRRSFSRSVWALLLAAAPFAQAEQTLIDQEYSASGVKILMVSVYDALPHWGHVPVQLEIHNRTQTDLEWRVQFFGSYAGHGANLETACRVAAGQIGQFQLSVPVTVRDWADRSQLQVVMEGPGIDSYQTNYSSQSFGSGRKRGSRPFFLMSGELAQASWSRLEARANKQNFQADGSLLDADSFSSDYRDWLGVTHCFISPGEMNALSGSQRAALETWLSQGGNLVLCTDSDQLDPLLTVSNANRLNGDIRLGAGRIEIMQLEAGEISWSPFKDQLTRGPNLQPLQALYDNYGRSDWLGEKVSPPALNEGLLMGIAFLFAVAVAPVNLIWLARKRRRHWMFATVPLLSVAASVVLIVSIFVGDGLGGNGNRFTLVLHQPGRAEKLLINEEYSVSGLLLNTRFKTEPNVAMIPSPGSMGISTRDLANQREYMMTSNLAGERWDQWFASRSLRGFLVTESRPSREKVTIQTENDTLAVLSQNEAAFAAFYYVDEAGEFYHAAGIGTGIPAQLTKVDRREFEDWMNEQKKAAGPRAEQILEAIPRPGMFFARAEPGASNRTETLDSIRFRDRVLVVGRAQR